MPVLRGLIFDFDGLILDTELPDYESWSEIFVEHGCSLPHSLWCECIGTGDSHFDPHAYLEQHVGRALDRSSIRSRRRSRYLQLISAQQVLPGVEDWLRQARELGLRTAIATSSSDDWAATHLRRLGLLDYFHCVRSAADVTNTKPHPELYDCARKALGLQPDEVVALEDSPNGVRAARAAGIYCIAVPNAMTRELAFEGADLRLCSLGDLSLNEFAEAYRSSDATFR